MDGCWERSVPFFELKPTEIESVLKEMDDAIMVGQAVAISAGCRNSNYKVKTSRGNFLLRVCPPEDDSYAIERSLHKKLDNRVTRPALLHVSEQNVTGRACLVYEYIDALSLQAVAAKGRLTNEDISRVARYAAWIHNSKSYEIVGLMDGELNIKFQLPPFSSWFELFMGERACGRLGDEVIARLRRLLEDKDECLARIDTNYCLVHGDYRPANMLLDEQGKVWVVDWEMPAAGHPLADVGQFFRYGQCFDQSQRKVFSQVYNQEAKRQLPGDWYPLARLRDLVNLLQMINVRSEQPKKHQDLRHTILYTLGVFGY